MMNKWSKGDIDFLIKNYPIKGKEWCCNKLKKTEASIRQKTSRLGLKIDRKSDFFKEFQKRAALGKIGNKLSDEHKKNISESNKGKIFSDEMKFNMSVAQKKRLEDPNERIKISKSTKKWIKEKGHPKGMLGKKQKKYSIEKGIKTKLKRYGTLNFRNKENIDRMLETRFKRYGKYSNTSSKNAYSRCKKGWIDFGNGKKYFFRSGWEMNYAHYLEWIKKRGDIKDWFYEVDTFWFKNIKRGVRSYLPDFKIIENNGNFKYDEVKGWMDDRSKTKLRRMKKYYPEIRIDVIGSNEYKEIKKWSRLIEGWED